jgi:hypothetical protein
MLSLKESIAPEVGYKSAYKPIREGFVMKPFLLFGFNLCTKGAFSKFKMKRR